MILKTDLGKDIVNYNKYSSYNYYNKMQRIATFKVTHIYIYLILTNK